MQKNFMRESYLISALFAVVAATSIFLLYQLDWVYPTVWQIVLLALQLVAFAAVRFLYMRYRWHNNGPEGVLYYEIRTWGCALIILAIIHLAMGVYYLW